MDAQIVSDGTSYTIIENTMEGLTQFDKDSNVIPAIAESWDVSPDGLSYTFHIREDAKWSNGEPVRAQDFVFAWRRLADPKTGSETQFLMADTSGIKNAETIAYKGARTAVLLLLHRRLRLRHALQCQNKGVAAGRHRRRHGQYAVDRKSVV